MVLGPPRQEQGSLGKLSLSTNKGLEYMQPNNACKSPAHSGWEMSQRGSEPLPPAPQGQLGVAKKTGLSLRTPQHYLGSGGQRGCSLSTQLDQGPSRASQTLASLIEQTLLSSSVWVTCQLVELLKSHLGRRTAHAQHPPQPTRRLWEAKSSRLCCFPATDLQGRTAPILEG